ncbi:MAG: DNA double-strand break repair nuclease NurA [Thermoplasmatota archaeon]
MMEPQALQHVLATLRTILRDSDRFSGTVDVNLDAGSFSASLSPEQFAPLQPAPSGRTAALDGSSIRALDGLSFVVSVCRAAAVTADEDMVRDTHVSDMRAAALSRDTCEEVFLDAYRELSDVPPPSVPDTVEEAAGALRGLQEQALARAMIGQLDGGDLCLLDGALHGNRWLQPVVDATCRLAAECDVHLAAVSKRSDLAARGVPLLYWIRRHGDRTLPGRRWRYPLSEERCIYVAKLHPAARHVFRIDVNPYDGEPGEVLPRLASLSDDVATLGYPYPLAAAHRAVVVTADEASYWQRRLREQALNEGFTRDDWEGLFYDYHAYLG